MRILIASLLKRKVTKDSLSSRPRIIYEIIKGLIKKGHQISIIGTANSIIDGATTIPIIPQSLVEMPIFENPLYAEASFLVQLAKKIEQIADGFDLVHNHTYPEFINLFIADKIHVPLVTTIHAQATPELDQVLSLFPKTYFISISKAHQKLFKKTNIYKVVYNGIDTNIYSFIEKKENYLLWLGRLAKAKNKDGNFIDPKGVKWAIKLAQETGSRLLLGGNIEDMEFYNREVKPHLNDKIQWVGPLSTELKLDKQQVASLMQKSKAFLMTINWYEPFGLVMAEAMSCGTPVIGFDRGSVSELIVDGKTGFTVPPEKGINGLKEALSKVNMIKPQDCREHVINNFSVETMVKNYEKTYQEIISLSKK